MRDWQEGRDKRGTKGTEEQRVRANKPQKGLLGRRTSSEAQVGGWEGGSVYTHPLKHMTDRPGPCVSHMPGCISCKRHQYLSHFPFQRRKPPITPEDGKIIRDKSNYPTSGRPSASVSCIIPLQHLGEVGRYCCILKYRCRPRLFTFALIALRSLSHICNGNCETYIQADWIKCSAGFVSLVYHSSRRCLFCFNSLSATTAKLRILNGISVWMEGVMKGCELATWTGEAFMRVY